MAALYADERTSDVERPEDVEEHVLDMLWDLVYWHALVKLRLHSQSTVLLLDAATSEVGRSVRRFRRVTDHIETYDLPQDDAAKAKKRRKKKQTDDQDPEVPTKKRVCKPAKLNLTMYKWHSNSFVDGNEKEI